MIESSILAGQLLGPALQQPPQSLPAAQAKDTQRFQDLISGSGSSNASTSIQPQSLDNSVLQIVEPSQDNSAKGLIDQVINQATKIDGNYHSLLDQLGNRQSFDTYLSKQRDTTVDQMVTYPRVNDVNAHDKSPLEASLANVQDSNKAALEYQTDLNDWSMQFRIWSSGVDLVSAAVKRVSTAFQTLFRASG